MASKSGSLIQVLSYY